MPGKNLFYESASNVKTASDGAEKPCIFISHRKADIEKARELGNMIKQCDFNIYLDEEDKLLQAAELKRDHAKVVEYIEAGLERSTHFLGIVTEQTKGSWWVPYELGMARGKHKICAHYIDREVSELPAFIRVAEILTDARTLKAWLLTFKMEKRGGAAVTESFDALTRLFGVQYAIVPSFVPENRPVASLKFYDHPW